MNKAKLKNRFLLAMKLIEMYQIEIRECDTASSGFCGGSFFEENMRILNKTKAKIQNKCYLSSEDRANASHRYDKK